MPATYTVTRVKHAGQKPNPHGGQLEKFYVGLKNESEDHPDVYWQRKEGATVNVGDEVYGTVSQGDYGWRFKAEQRQDGSGGFGGGGGAKDAYWENKEKRDIEGVKRMGRAHAQEMALRTLALTPDSTRKLSDDELRRDIKNWTDWFDADVGISGGGFPSGATTPKSTPAADSSASPSDKQLNLIERLLTEGGVEGGDRILIKEWATEALTPGQGGTASKAIDGLMQARDETIGRLLAAAKRHAESQSEIPGDDRDLQPAPAVVIGATGEDIPF